VLIWDNYHIITSELCATIETGKPEITAIIREPGYRKVCARKCENAHSQPQNRLKKHLHRTSPAQGERQMLFCQE
jgi:hypothetical protein